MYNPLAFPVRMENNTIYVLDETQLPFKETYITVKSLDEALEVLGKMKTRAFGQVLLFFYTCALVREIDKTAMAFKKIRPTFDFFRLAEILKTACGENSNIRQAVNGFVQGFEEKRKKRVKKLAKLLPAEARILTICNLNGELLYLYSALKEIGKEAIFFVSETRPYLQGTRLTFWELNKAHIACIRLSIHL